MSREKRSVMKWLMIIIYTVTKTRGGHPWTTTALAWACLIDFPARKLISRGPILPDSDSKERQINPRTDFRLDADGETGHQQRRFQLEWSTSVDSWFSYQHW